MSAAGPAATGAPGPLTPQPAREGPDFSGAVLEDLRARKVIA